MGPPVNTPAEPSLGTIKSADKSACHSRHGVAPVDKIRCPECELVLFLDENEPTDRLTCPGCATLFQWEQDNGCYTIFYDRGWARFSPGTSLLFEVVRRSLEQGISVDLMTGEQPYKMRMAESTQDLFKVSASVSEMHKLFPASVAADIAA